VSTTIALVASATAAIVAFALGWFAGSGKTRQRAARALAKITAQLRSGDSPAAEDGVAVFVEETRELSQTLAEGWVPRGSEWNKGIKATLRRVSDYMQTSVSEPLQEGLERGGAALADKVNEVLDAVEDVEFFVEEVAHDLSVRDLTRTLEEVIREYTRDFGILVKMKRPSQPVRARVAPEAFKDALFLVLVNAGRFGMGAPVEVELQEEGGRARIHVRDRGPGFTEEALQRAMDPFYTTEKGSLGMGLSHAREVIGGHGGEIWLRNRDGGGGEVEISIPRVT
jgi:signal transduction histidine kinase